MTRKTLVDYISEEDYPRYTELLNKAEQAKAAAPKAAHKPRGPMTKEQKIKMGQDRLAKLQAKLDALMASETSEE
jgi:hypothetical protein